MIDNEFSDESQQFIDKNDYNRKFTYNEGELKYKNNDKSSTQIIFDQIDIIIILVLTYVSYWTRSLSLQHPDNVVFDEVHFGKFTNYYVNHSYFFDIHPPAAKLIIYAFSRAFQYHGDINFEYPNYRSLDYYSLRQIPALFATFCSPLIYLSCKGFNLSRFASLTAGIMIICETSMIVEAKFILTDGILHFFTCLSIFFLSLVYRYDSYTPEWVSATIASGIAIGLTISTKFTSLSFIPLCAFVHLIQILEKRKQFDMHFLVDLTQRGLLTAFPIFLIYFACFYLHFMLLPYKGTGYHGMSQQFQNTLIDRNATNAIRKSSNYPVFFRIMELNTVMHFSNMKLNATHPYSSKWYQWPFLSAKWVLFWISGAKRISCLIQPFNVLVGTISIIIQIVLLLSFKLLNDKYKKKFIFVSIFSVGYICSYLPFCLIPRILFIYHYIIPLIFGILTFVAFIDTFVENKYKTFILQISQFLTIFALIYWSPICYGYPSDYKSKQWSTKW